MSLQRSVNHSGVQQTNLSCIRHIANETVPRRCARSYPVASRIASGFIRELFIRRIGADLWMEHNDWTPSLNDAAQVC